MKNLVALFFSFIFLVTVYGQNKFLEDIVSQGTQLHDEGKYDEAIEKYKEALKIDPNSTIANYEMSFTYFTTEKWEEAIIYSQKVIKLKGNNQHEAFIVLGNSLDMLGNSEKAIKTYEQALKKFPKSNLLNYNLALSLYNQGDLKKAEKAAINAILAKPTHGSSHLLLSAIMKKRGERVKSILPIYYFLMIEPKSKRSNSNYMTLTTKLGVGVVQKDEKNINITIPSLKGTDSEFGAVEIMVSMLAASKYLEENMGKSEMQLFIDTNKSLFSVLNELKRKNKGFWWDFYVTKLYALVESNNIEAFSYHISQSANNNDVAKWISENASKMKNLMDWLEK